MASVNENSRFQRVQSSGGLCINVLDTDCEADKPAFIQVLITQVRENVNCEREREEVKQAP